ncbi:hypothetical protein CEXT_452521 [Caerostris extrusa]|uniref:Uncharacterized protein n=1 Tax=Caerostris extrusa TaxID=172846 RepID=A0AAV4SPY5_CAEEX|nr:hypothetical protein CEXT_452521 [Caerostris extrusa]
MQKKKLICLHTVLEEPTAPIEGKVSQFFSRGTVAMETGRDGRRASSGKMDAALLLYCSGDAILFSGRKTGCDVAGRGAQQEKYVQIACYQLHANRNDTPSFSSIT